MKHLLLEKVIKEIIDIGFSYREESIKHISRRELIPWEKQFNLTKWVGWTFEHRVAKNEVLESGRVQEIIVNFTFTHGINSFVILKIYLSRQMPVGEWSSPPPPYEEFTGCYWVPGEIHYNISPETMNSIINLDLMIKHF